MKKWGVLIALIGLLAGPAFAQHQLTQYTTLFSGTGTGDGTVRLDVQSFSSVLLKVRIDSTGTVNFKGSADGLDATNLATCALVSDTAGTQVASTTASGDYFCSTANLKEVFINVSANGSGVTVNAIGSTASAKRGGGGGSGSVTSVDASGGVETASGSAITGTGTIRGATCVNEQTGTSYTVLATDRGCVVTFTNADPVAVTLPEAGTTGFESGFYFQPVNLGVGTVTITPSTSMIQAGADLDLTTGKSTTIASDGTNYVHAPGMGLTTEAQGLGDVIAINRTYGGAVSQATAVREGDSGAGEYWVRFRDATDGLISDCEKAGVLGDCDKKIKIYTGHVFDFLNNAGTSIGKLTESTGAWTNFKLDTTATGNAFTSYKRLPGCGGDLVGVDPATSTAGHIWDKVPSVTAPTATASVLTNQSVGLARFPDSDGDFGIQIKCRLPANVTIGQVDAVLTWVSAGTGNYRPQVFTKCYGDDVAADAAYNSAQAFTVAAGTATRGQIDTLSNLTMTGCSAGNEFFIKLIRNRTEGSDTGSSTFDVKSFELWATITE